MGAEISRAGGRRAARALGGTGRRLLRTGLRSCFLGRPRSLAAERAKETEGLALAAMALLAALCLLAGILPGIFIDALAPITTMLVGQSMPLQSRRALSLHRADRREPQLL